LPANSNRFLGCDGKDKVSERQSQGRLQARGGDRWSDEHIETPTEEIDMTRSKDSLRTRPDGSIDTGFYMARGRHMRSEAAHALLRPEPKQSPRRRRGLARLFGGGLD
jgi:hypothetical protein